MLGHSRMVSQLHVNDCLERGWIVVVPDHRLCPQVDVLEGPISDCRDLLSWIHDGHLDLELSSRKSELGTTVSIDKSKVVVMGTSSGGTLAYALATNTSNPPLAILDFYGPKNFQDPFWTTPLSIMTPPHCTPEMESAVYSIRPVPTKGGVSLEGQAGPQQANSKPSVDPRHAFAMNAIATGRVMDVIFPRGRADASSWALIDPLLNVTKNHPPTCIVHGLEDKMVPIELSRVMWSRLQEERVKGCKFVEVEGEGHTFAGQMKKGTRTWDRQREGFDWLEGIIKGK